MALVEITNGHVVVGVLPNLGGRVALLKTPSGENVLDSNPRFWKEPLPEPSLERPFAPWNGRIVWVGPQSGFWSQQDLRPEMKDAGSTGARGSRRTTRSSSSRCTGRTRPWPPGGQ